MVTEKRHSDLCMLEKRYIDRTYDLTPVYTGIDTSCYTWYTMSLRVPTIKLFNQSINQFTCTPSNDFQISLVCLVAFLQVLSTKEERYLTITFYWDN